jgi:signal transduction histidine kinase
MAAIDEARIRHLLDVGWSLMSDLDVDLVLERVVGAARDLLGVTYAAVGVLDPGRAEFERFVSTGIDEETRGLIGSPPKGRGVLGVMIEDPRPLRVDDVAMHPRSYGFPVSHPPLRALLGAPILIRGKAWGNLYAAADDEVGFSEADEETLVMLAAWAAAAIDNALRYATSERRREELERAVRVLDATRDVLLAIGGSAALSRVLELIAKRGRALVNALSVVIMLREGEELAVAASAGPMVDIGVLSREHAAGPPASGAAAQELLVPMNHRGELVGLLAATRGADAVGEFSEEDHQLLELFAATAATAVAMARIVEADRVRSARLIADAERRRWARELHDQTLQGLASIRLQLGAMVRGADPAEVDPIVREVLTSTEAEIHNLRAIISDLRPPALEELGLLEALQVLVVRHARDGLDIVPAFELPDPRTGAERLDPDLENAVYRIVQEGLTNVIKHAGARTVRVSVTAASDAVAIELRDDGAGFDASSRTAGFGLGGIGERVNLAGGTFEIQSSPAGTLLCVRLPMVTPGRR